MSDRNKLIGARVRPEVSAALKANAEATGLQINMLVEDALLFFWGSEDPMLKSRRELAASAWKHTKGKTKRPFDSAPGPASHNVAHNGIVPDSGLRKVGVVAQLVERLNGIQKVAGSIPVSSTTATVKREDHGSALGVPGVSGADSSGFPADGIGHRLRRRSFLPAGALPG